MLVTGTAGNWQACGPLTIARPGGGVWTRADFNSLEVAVYTSDGGYVDRLWLEIDYVASGACLM